MNCSGATHFIIVMNFCVALFVALVSFIYLHESCDSVCFCFIDLQLIRVEHYIFCMKPAF